MCSFKKSKSHKAHGPKLLSPLALLVLAACGGGGGGVQAPQPFSRDGNANKGPLDDALAFLDYDLDGIFDADSEPSVRTNSEGFFELTGEAGYENVPIVVLADDRTVDASSGASLSGLVLKAPASAKVVSLASTMIQEAVSADPSIDLATAEAQVKSAFGLEDVADVLSFNPYSLDENASDADKKAAMKVEAASQQVAAVIQSLSSAAEGAGLSTADAVTQSIKALTEVVQANNSGSALDLSDSTVLSDVVSKTKTNIDTVIANKSDVTSDDYDPDFDASSVNAVAFETVANSAVTVVATVAADIKDAFTDAKIDAAIAGDIDLLDSVETKALFSVTQALRETVSAASEDLAAGKAGAAGQVIFDVAAAKTNLAPNDITISGATGESGNILSISEAAASLELGTLGAVDKDLAGDASGQAVTFALSEASQALFEIIDGKLYLKAQPDYEALSSDNYQYKAKIIATDELGLSFSKTFTVNVENADESQFLIQTDAETGSEVVVEDAIGGGSAAVFEKNPVKITGIDLSGSGNVVFGTSQDPVRLDINNIADGINGDTAFVAPKISVPLLLAPGVEQSVEKVISIELFQSKTAGTELPDTWDSASEHKITVDLGVVLSGNGDTFAITPNAQATIGVYKAGLTDPSSATANILAATSDIPTIAYNSADQTIEFDVFSLLLAQASSLSSSLGTNLSSVLAEGDYYLTLQGLPLVDQAGVSVEQLSGVVRLEDVNALPVFRNIDGETITDVAVAATEDSAAITGTVRARDVEDSTVSYDVVESNGLYGVLSIDATGQYTYRPNNTDSVVNGLNAGEILTESFEVTATDSDGGVGRLKLTVTVSGVDDAPTAVKLISPADGSSTDITQTLTLNEIIDGGSDADGLRVAKLDSTDAEGYAVTYEITDNPSDLFVIEKSTTAADSAVTYLKLKDGYSLDYEDLSTKSVSITLQASSRSGTNLALQTAPEQTFTFNVNNLNDTPTLSANIIDIIALETGDVTKLQIIDEDLSNLKIQFGTLDYQNYLYDLGNYGQLIFDKLNYEFAYALDFKNQDVVTLPEGSKIEEHFAVSLDDLSMPVQHLTISVQIEGVNQNPQALLQKVEIAENAGAGSFNIDLNSYFVDVDKGSVLRYEIDDAAQAEIPHWLVLNSNEGMLSGNPGVEDYGNTSIDVFAVDDLGAVSSVLSFEMFINSPVTSVEIPELFVNETETMSLDLSDYFFDKEGIGAVDIQITPVSETLPNWISFDDQFELTFSPAENDFGEYKFNITASDLLSSATQELEIFVNSPPNVIKIFNDHVVVDEDTQLMIALSDHFEDDSKLTYFVTSEDSDRLIDFVRITDNILILEPENEDVGNYALNISASDGLASVSTNLQVSVANVNDKPTSLSDTVVLELIEDEHHTLMPNDYFTDIDENDTLSYSLSYLENDELDIGWIELSENTNLLQFSPENAHAGNSDFLLRATDRDGLTADLKLVVSVENTYDPPSITGSTDYKINQDQRFQVSLDNLFEPDYGKTLSFDFLNERPVWLQYEPSTKMLSGTPTNDDVGDYFFQVRASDGTFDGVVTADFTVQVQDVNDKPVLINPFDFSQKLNPLAEFAYDFSHNFQDVDENDELRFELQIVSDDLDVELIEFDEEDGHLVIEPSQALVDKTVEFVITAIDLQGASMQSTFYLKFNDIPSILKNISELNIIEDQTSRLDITSFFYDSDDLVFSIFLNDSPHSDFEWVSFEDGVLILSPDNVAVGNYDVVIHAGDTINTSSINFELAVENVDDPITLTDENVPIEMNIYEGVNFSLDIVSGIVFDEDEIHGEKLSASIVRLSNSGAEIASTYNQPFSWMNFNTDSSTLYGLAPNKTVLNYPIHLMVSVENTLGDELHYPLDIYLKNFNDPVTITRQIPDFILTSEQVFTRTIKLDNYFSDEDLSTQNLDVPEILSSEIKLLGESQYDEILDLITVSQNNDLTVSGLISPQFNNSAIEVAVTDTSGEMASQEVKLINADRVFRLDGAISYTDLDSENNFVQIPLELEYQSNGNLDNILFLGSANVNYQNILNGLNSENNFVSPKLSFDLNDGSLIEDTVDFEIIIELIEILEASDNTMNMRDTGENAIKISFDARLLNDSGSYEIELSSTIYGTGWIHQPSLSFSASDVVTVRENDMLSIVQNNDLIELNLNLLSLIDDLGATARAVLGQPLKDETDYYLKVDGLPLSDPYGSYIDILEGTVYIT